ncbi:hypothetical protein Pmani_006255 [Petrolisthes manimaculis]|uniref:Uncharacterized protein n=1 Tax=Petrolisthes manimaculis TaxID=1843537 RepID=A0AAE1QAP8_9EUCA|nr:hypothetical protein Pmani_030014 [Petrolisthes manimaculis]KAK4323018.1 hypothetical protein Pmani_006255 [Petrolisthes manimaculis]
MKGDARTAAWVLTSLVLGVMLVLVLVMGVCATPTTSSPHTYRYLNITHRLQQFSIFNKGTHVLYGSGRKSEVDLPKCESPNEACNLAHKRFWLTPITERLCRCPDGSECPPRYTSLRDSLTQHVSNRGQLKFCDDGITKLGVCKEGDIALSVRKLDKQIEVDLPTTNTTTVIKQVDSHTTLACRCPWPRAWTLIKTVNTSPNGTLSTYTCSKLGKCMTGEECGFIRQDTLESYYTCSCPEQHLCLFIRPQTPIIVTHMHFHGWAYTARCMPNY